MKTHYGKSYKGKLFVYVGELPRSRHRLTVADWFWIVLGTAGMVTWVGKLIFWW